jgi:hypothetical protein
LRQSVTLATFRDDPLFPRIARAVSAILKHSTLVVPVDVLVHMGVLAPRDLERWRRGEVAYLEQVIAGNRTRLGRALRILRMHAHDLNLVPREERYSRRFSKSGEREVERAYARHFIWPGKRPFHVPHE